MSAAVESVLFWISLFLVAGTMLSLSSHPHWFVRGWDFPRVQIIALAWLVVILYLSLRLTVDQPPRWSWGWYVVPAVLLTIWHGFLIAPYTPLYPKQAKSTHPGDIHPHHGDPDTLRVVLSNVEQENDRYDQWRNVIGKADPDVLVVLEADDRWTAEVAPLFDRYPHRVLQPQENWYGILLLSRLPILEHQVRFLVQDDIPSVDAKIQLDNGQPIRLIAVHPRPPEPWRGNHATARDAELTIWGRELGDDPQPIVIGGDLNDVAWSSTTRLFLRTSQLLDPRRGRGFFNTFHAGHWYLRYPLDHIFHSQHFTVSKIQRLPFIGSDHFPMLIDLRLDPRRQHEHDVLEEQNGDSAEIELRIKRAEQDEDIDGEAVDQDAKRMTRH